MDAPPDFRAFYTRALRHSPAYLWSALDSTGRVIVLTSLLIAAASLLGLPALGVYREVPAILIALAVVLFFLVAFLRAIHAGYRSDVATVQTTHDSEVRGLRNEVTRTAKEKEAMLERALSDLQDERDSHAVTREALATLRVAKPRLTLGEAVFVGEQYLDRTHLAPDNSHVYAVSAPPMHRVPLETVWLHVFRVPVTNHGGGAQSVVVQLKEIVPATKEGHFPAPLHLVGDNPDDHSAENYGRSRGFSLGRGAMEQVDLMAIERDPPHRCFIYVASAADAALEVRLQGTSTFRLVAYADGEPFEADYRVVVDQHRLSISLVQTPS